jgi:hypothetical protein
MTSNEKITEVKKKRYNVYKRISCTVCYMISSQAVVRIRIRTRIRRMRMFLGLLDPDLDPLVRGFDPNPSVTKQK